MGQESKKAQDCSESYATLIQGILSNATEEMTDEDNHLKECLITIAEDLHTKQQSQWSFIPLPYITPSTDVESALQSFLKQSSRYTLAQILPLVLQRPPFDLVVKNQAHLYQYSFPESFDIDDKHYELLGIIAFASFHYVYFKRDENHYLLIDDEKGI